MAGVPSPFGTLTVVTDELRQFAALAPLATIAPVSASMGVTPPLSGSMPESMSPDAHVRFCVEHTCTVTASAASGIGTLIDSALTIAGAYDATDLANASAQSNLVDPLAPVTPAPAVDDHRCWDRDRLPADDSAAQD
jgi:hypothetical protein